MGFYVVHIGQTNIFRYRYKRNWLYTLQRLTGAITFVFLIYHMGTTVGAKLWEGKHHFEAAPFLMDILINQVKKNKVGRPVGVNLHISKKHLVETL